MAELESQHATTELQGEPAPQDDASGIGAFSAPMGQASSDFDDDRPVRGISVIPIPRREIARLQGTLRLGELPRHRPTVIFDFDAGGRLRDADDE
jgi:hypothetical protein